MVKKIYLMTSLKIIVKNSSLDLNISLILYKVANPEKIKSLKVLIKNHQSLADYVEFIKETHLMLQVYFREAKNMKLKPV